MPKKDFHEKRLEAINEVFADIINVLLFNGERRVRAEDLRNEFVRSGYNFEEKFEEQERDVKKIWMSQLIRLAILAMENQTREDLEYIFRELGYNGADYRDQVRERADIRRANAKAKKAYGKDAVLQPIPDFYPVIT
ncbi:MAG: hypothetical protein IJ088_14985 [Clostridia bacterium]|nr:hypothetical protein [Clostridia bacterium]